MDDKKLEEMQSEIASLKSTVEQLSSLNKKLENENEVSRNLLKEMDTAVSRYESMDVDNLQETVKDLQETVEEYKELGDKDKLVELIEEVTEIAVDLVDETASKSDSKDVSLEEKVESLRLIKGKLAKLKKYEDLGEPEEIVADKEESEKVATDALKVIEELQGTVEEATKVVEDAATTLDESEVSEIKSELDEAKAQIDSLTDLVEEATEVIEKVESLFGSVKNMEVIASSYRSMKESSELDSLVTEFGVDKDKAKYVLDTLGDVDKARDFLANVMPSTMKSETVKEGEDEKLDDGEKLESVVRQRSLQSNLNPKTSRLLNLISKV